MEALVNKIIPFSCVDGPGNRTAVFLQGCNFDCKYCHNPETRNICENCGACVKKCPTGALRLVGGKVQYEIAKCCNCDTCIKTCKYGSSPKIRYMSPEAVFDEISKQIPFIRGITVSGGECTLYPQFLTQLFRLCRQKKLSTMLDSNGSLDFEKYQELLEVTDGVMLDIKAFTTEEHVQVTGMNNALVLKNAHYLAIKGKLHEVRTVVVPELFDTVETVKKTAKMLAPYLAKGDIRYKVIAYRPMGVREAYAHYKVPQKEYLEMLAGLIQAEGFQNIIII